jgi:hypothetical protein
MDQFSIAFERQYYGKGERTFACKNCGLVVIVEFGAYTGGPLAYDDYAKCKNCGLEYTNQSELSELLRARRVLNRRS